MDRQKLLTRGMVTYAEGSPPGGYDPKARLKVMDRRLYIGASFGVVKEMKERLVSLPLADQRKVLGENAVRFYNLAH